MSYLDLYKSWLSNPDLDESLKKELLFLSDEKIKDAFYTDLKFGTAGIRGIMGAGINRMNIHVVRKVTLGFAKYLLHKYKKNIKVAICYDNRLNSREFAFEAAKVLAANNISSYVYDELRPTPMLSFAVRYLKCQGGIMITASHNPKEYNGYKAYNDNGAQVNLEESAEVIKEIESIPSYFNIATDGSEKFIHLMPSEIEEEYLKLVREIKYNETKRKTPIVYSPLHGTGAPIIYPLLKSSGYNVSPYLPQMENDPDFGATKSSNPEDIITYDVLIKYAGKINARAILVTDPDADRLGVAVLHNEKFVLLNGNQTAALELHYILNNYKRLPEDGYVFTTLVTSDLIKELAYSYNLNVVTTLTGFKFIGEQAKLIEGKHPYIFGCEESYGSLIRDFVRDKDAVQAVYLLSEMINYFDEQGKTLVDYLNDIYKQYGTYYEKTNQLTFTGEEGLDKMKRIMKYYQDNPLLIDGYRLLYHDDLMQGYRSNGKKLEKLDLPLSDVLKFYYNDNLYVIFRPSGTEPKLKIYYGAKTKHMDEAIKLIDNINEGIERELSKI